MKFIQFCCAFMLPVMASCSAQTKQDTSILENRVFAIDSYVNGNKENSEDLTFKNGMLSGSECVKYGFTQSSYAATASTDGAALFHCTMLSPTEGKMVWEGKVNEKALQGKVVWSKQGQADMIITYNGKEK